MAAESEASQACRSFQIDPQLLLADAGSSTGTTGANGQSVGENAIPTCSGNLSPQKDVSETSTRTVDVLPQKDASGNIVATREEYEQQLLSIKKKVPLQEGCTKLGLRFPKSGNLDKLRNVLLDHWFPFAPAVAGSRHNVRISKKAVSTRGEPNERPNSLVDPLLPAFSFSTTPTLALSQGAKDHDEAELIREFDIEGADASDLLGFDDEVDEDYHDSDEFEDDPDLGLLDQSIDGGELESELLISDSPRAFQAYQASIRVAAAKRAEGNRRSGGIKTQKAMEFVGRYRKNGAIKDEIVDEHSLLLFIEFSAERPKRTRRGIDKPGTFVGASQLKKLFFGALRIRKEQDAADPTLTSRRRATSVVVWDALKNRMDEALERARNGLVPNEDAPDIVANTFLAEVTDEELDKVSTAFLSHREIRCAINGHLAWTAQHATGNRGDDLRALKLCELQPWAFLHPNNETEIFTVLGLQGEEKAGKRGMKTTINPSYTSFIAHRRPEKCALGAFAFLHHYLHDVQDIATSEGIDWEINNTWRQIRLIHSSKSRTSVYSDQSLYNLYVKAFYTAGLDSRLKLHLARHILGYLQERFGVDSRETAKLGWKRGETYSDVYSPALPKKAILACHGYKEHEVYDPIWRHVHVPQVFQQLVCPKAEEILDKIRGKKNLRGTTGHWEMIIKLRPYLFQCGAAIYNICPSSPIFRLPALAHNDVRNWMKTTFRTELSVLEANAGSPVDLQRLQDRTLQLALEEVRSLQSKQAADMQKLSVMFQRRTAVLSPTKGFSTDLYHRTASLSSTEVPNTPAKKCSLPLRIETANTSTVLSNVVTELGDTGVYEAQDLTYRAFVSDSPKTPTDARPKTQVDLVLPPLAAFQAPGPSQPQLLWPPVLGQQGVNWADIFNVIKQPKELWARWKPSGTLDTYKTVQAVWDLFNEGESIYSGEIKTGKNPPLRLVEKHFGSQWRSGSDGRKTWERFREIPDWIDSHSFERGVAPTAIIAELEEMRMEGNKKLGLNALSKELKRLRGLRKQEVNPEREPSEGFSAPSSSPSRSSSPSLDPIPGTKKRRAKPLDPRKRPKLSKT